MSNFYVRKSTLIRIIFYVEYVAKLVPNSEFKKEEYNLSASTYVEQEDTKEVIDITELNKHYSGILARKT